MNNVIPMQRLRFEREVKKCPNVQIVVDLRKPGLIGIPALYFSYENDHILLRIGSGPGFVPPAPFTVEADGLRISNVGWRINGTRTTVFVPWANLYSVTTMHPPSDGGTPLRRAQ